MKKILTILLTIIILLSTTGCIKRDKMEDIDIITTIYPIDYVINRLYEENSNINSIYPRGIIINEYEFTKMMGWEKDMKGQFFSDRLEYIMDNNTVPRNIREAASESNDLLKNEEQDQSVRISTVLGKLDEISNDPNIPVHARTLIWEVLSKLESI